MARRVFAPSHSLLAESRYIPPSDSAWDHDRIRAELKALRKAWDGKGRDPADPDPLTGEGGHTWVRYDAGFTRFDLQAEGISEYLDKTKRPESWLLRRLTREERIKVGRSEDPNRAAYLLGCVGVENGDPELAKLLEADSRDLDAVVRATEEIANSIFDQVGMAVLNASADLMPQEKKASGAHPGGSGG